MLTKGREERIVSARGSIDAFLANQANHVSLKEARANNGRGREKIWPAENIVA